MKKISSLLIVVLLLMSMMTLTACSSDDAVVESVMEIDSNFSGHREITIKYPLDASIDSLLLELNKKNPLAEYKDSTFEYVGVEQDGYIFIMDIVFDSHDEYINQMDKLIGREVTSSVSLPDSVLCSGVRMKEDFDVADIISWITKLSENNEDTEGIEYDYSVNTVRIDDAVFNTESTIDISEREGMPLDSIIIETTNLKDSTYDRTITFLVPNNTYNKLSDSLQTYFLSITDADASYADWTSKGTCWEYKVIYKGLDIEELSQRTGLLLGTVSNQTYYGDKNNSSTPLSEGLIFEESFNTFSYIDEDGEDVPVTYKYALPTKTTYGEGSVFKDGKWVTEGEWAEGEYSVTLESDIVKIRIPDGIQYSINGINIKLDVKDEDDFVRTTDFLYSKNDSDGLVYAKNFFENKGAVVTVAKEADNYICRVINKGSSSEITDELVSFFGSGNFMAYEKDDSSIALSEKTEMTDFIDLSSILNSSNSEKPITYSVYSSCDENIIELSCNGTDVTENEEGILTVDVAQGQGTVTYSGNIPNIGTIILYCLIGLAMLFATIVVIMRISRNKKDDSKSTDESADDDDYYEKDEEEVLQEINEEIEDRIDTEEFDDEAQDLINLQKLINDEDDE